MGPENYLTETSKRKRPPWVTLVLIYDWLQAVVFWTSGFINISSLFTSSPAYNNNPDSVAASIVDRVQQYRWPLLAQWQVGDYGKLRTWARSISIVLSVIKLVTVDIPARMNGRFSGFVNILINALVLTALFHQKVKNTFPKS